jgi:hypothetical protein
LDKAHPSATEWINSLRQYLVLVVIARPPFASCNKRCERCAELECHVSCEHCGLLYDNRCPMAAGACAATGTTHNDPEFDRCEVCQLVVPKATQGFRLGDYLNGVECVHRFHPKAAAVLDEQCLRWPCCGARGAGAVGCASLRFKVHHDVEGLAAALRKL